MYSVGISLFLVVVCEVLIQLFAFRWCAITEVVLSLFMIMKGFSLILSILPIGTILMVACALHIDQTAKFEKKYKHYLAINSN